MSDRNWPVCRTVSDLINIARAEAIKYSSDERVHKTLDALERWLRGELIGGINSSIISQAADASISEATQPNCLGNRSRPALGTYLLVLYVECGNENIFNSARGVLVDDVTVPSGHL